MNVLIIVLGILAFLAVLVGFGYAFFANEYGKNKERRIYSEEEANALAKMVKSLGTRRESKQKLEERIKDNDI